MSRETALAGLKSGSSHERLRAAVDLITLATTADIPYLNQARHSEKEATVSIQLSRIIEKLSIASVEKESSGELTSVEIARVKAETTAYVAGFVLHELGKHVGLTALAASSEIDDYENSKTHLHVSVIQSMLDALAGLKASTLTPAMTEFDLSELIEEILDHENSDKSRVVEKHGIRPFLLKSDRTLLRFAFGNALKNALESSIQARPSSDHSSVDVTVTWGLNDTDYWITLIDRGYGLADPGLDPFKLGNSTKTGHLGFGLAIAKLAIESLEGSALIENAPQGGALFHIRWKKL